MPDFAIQTFDGSLSSRAALEGKPVLLIFWNTWCPYCMGELPEINRVAEKFGPRGLAVLAINTGINDSESKARAYWKKQQYVFPAGFDRDFDMARPSESGGSRPFSWSIPKESCATSRPWSRGYGRTFQAAWPSKESIIERHVLSVHPELVEGRLAVPFMLRQAQHERVVISVYTIMD